MWSDKYIFFVYVKSWGFGKSDGDGMEIVLGWERKGNENACRIVSNSKF